MNYESISLWIAVASLVVSVAAAWIAQSSLSQAKLVAERDQRDWKQRKWFDLYFTASEFHDSLAHFQALYDESAVEAREFQRDRNELMFLLRRMYSMAVVFPQDPAITALMKCAIGLREPAQALSAERLHKFSDAVEGLRQKALVTDTAVLG
jgi:hypothetical protein